MININKELKESERFYSHELSLVGSLMAWDFPLLAVDTSMPRKVIFIFAKTDDLLNAVESYWNDTRLVSPKKYFNALREAKSRIYGT